MEEINNIDDPNLKQHVQVPHKIRESDNISYKILGFYAMLRKYMNGDTKECYPSYATLQKDTGLSIPTIRKYVDVLEQEGHIQVIRGGKHTSNRYKFNTDSDLYSKFEMFSFKFLNDKKLSFRDKSAYITLQEDMFKTEDGQYGKMSDTKLQISRRLKASYNTVTDIINNLISCNALVIADSNAKDLETGEHKLNLIFQLDVLGQATLYNQKKLKEHEDKLAKHDNELNDIGKKVSELEKIVKICYNQLNEQNKKEIVAKLKNEGFTIQINNTHK